MSSINSLPILVLNYRRPKESVRLLTILQEYKMKKVEISVDLADSDRSQIAKENRETIKICKSFAKKK